MSWKDSTYNSTLDWLLEPENPGVRYLALRDLVGAGGDSPELRSAKQQAHAAGPISVMLDAMQPEGYWDRPGNGYNPKYHSTVWEIILLGQLGASVEQDPRVAKACAYMLAQLHPGGQFSSNPGPAGTVDCLQGNLCWALLELGVEPAQLAKAFDWMARSQTGEGIAPLEAKDAPMRYYAYKCGPGYACGVNSGACAWGAVKVMLAFSRLPQAERSTQVQKAMQMGVGLLLGIDPATAAYPTRTDSKPNSAWWKFGFPVFYITDLLQLVEALARLGYGQDPRLAHALDLICGKADGAGRWALEYEYTGKTLVDFGEKRAPSKWVTLRALRTLKLAGELD
jgi:hypothetical protein